jgi:hypothetical protein
MNPPEPTLQATESSKKSILELSHDEARNFFLKAESYCSLDLPPYIVFGSLIADVNGILNGKKLSDMMSNNNKPKDYDDINHTILNNKDGRYAWRPFQLIHPALYVSLVHCITEEPSWTLICERFKEFSKNTNIRCLSLPIQSLLEEKDKAEQVSHWWGEVEQKSVELSLEYEFLLETDVTDCYGSIYTHSIAWAVHKKDEAKKNRNDLNFIGNIIDRHIQDMRHGQTNGIPQGSVLMDFIAEIVLGYADLELSEKIRAASVLDYTILRYRDDYRIFVNNPQDGEKLVKLLTEVMIGLGLKLNPSKTRASSDVVRASIKSDKLAWIGKKKWERSLQKHLLIIHEHAMHFPNAGSLIITLSNYHKRITNIKRQVERPLPLIGIVVDIAYRNPRAYSICTAILSKLLSFIKTKEEKQGLLEKIKRKFSRIPNTGHLDIWLQRATWKFDSNIEYEEPICKLVNGQSVAIWNVDWISSPQLKKAIDVAKIVDNNVLKSIEDIIQPKEVELFISKTVEGYY